METTPNPKKVGRAAAGFCPGSSPAQVGGRRRGVADLRSQSVSESGCKAKLLVRERERRDTWVAWRGYWAGTRKGEDERASGKGERGGEEQVEWAEKREGGRISFSFSF